MLLKNMWELEVFKGECNMFQFEQWISELNANKKEYALGILELELNTIYLFSEEKIDCHLFVKIDGRTFRVRNIYLEQKAIDPKWIMDILARKKQKESYYVLSEMDYRMFILYYELIYLRSGTYEKLQALKATERFSENIKENALEQINVFFRENGYHACAQKHITNYINVNVYCQLEKNHKGTLVSYFLSKIYWINLFKIVYFQSRHQFKTVSDNQLLEIKRQVSNLSPFHNSDSTSGCQIFVGENEEKEKCFVKVASKKEAKKTIALEKKAARILSGSQYVLTDDSTNEEYLIFSYLCGETLESFIKKRSFTQDECFRFLIFLNEILDQLFEKRIIHRDLRADNIFVTRSNEGEISFVLLDFGAAIINFEIDFSQAEIVRKAEENGLGGNCRAGMAVWDDAASAVLLFNQVCKECSLLECKQYEVLTQKVGRLIYFAQ